MLLPQNPMLAGAKQRMTGPQAEGRVGHIRDSSAKQLRLIVKVSGMRIELTTQEVLLENSELLGDLRDLFKSQLKELKGL